MIYDQKGVTKERIRKHLLITEGQATADRIYRQMIIEETESRIDDGQ